MIVELRLVEPREAVFVMSSQVISVEPQRTGYGQMASKITLITGKTLWVEGEPRAVVVKLFATKEMTP